MGHRVGAGILDPLSCVLWSVFPMFLSQLSWLSLFPSAGGMLGPMLWEVLPLPLSYVLALAILSLFRPKIALALMFRCITCDIHMS